MPIKILLGRRHLALSVDPHSPSNQCDLSIHGTMFGSRSRPGEHTKQVKEHASHVLYDTNGYIFVASAWREFEGLPGVSMSPSCLLITSRAQRWGPSGERTTDIVGNAQDAIHVFGLVRSHHSANCFSFENSAKKTFLIDDICFVVHGQVDTNNPAELAN